MKKRDIKDFSRPELEAWLKEHNIAPYRAGQIFKWVYIRQADSFEEMTDLGKELRAVLEENYTIGRLEKANVEISSDGTRKYLFRLADGEYTESVLIPGKDQILMTFAHKVGQGLVDNLHHLLAGGETLHHLVAKGTFLDFGNKGLGYLIMDIRLKERHAHLFEGAFDVLLRELPMAPQVFKDRRQLFG